MGKKSKRKKGRNKNASTGSASSSLVVELEADESGRMPEKDARRLYAILECLRAIAQPWFDLEYAKVEKRPPPWKPGPLEKQIPSLSAALVDFILQNIEKLSEEIDSGRRDALCRRIAGHRLSKVDREQIRSWKLHVKDDFFVIDHIPDVGSVFCQVGRRKGTEGGPLGAERDRHEPRLFVVKGYVSPLAKLTEGMVDLFKQSYPGALRQYKKKYKRITFVRVAIVPYCGSLTYIGTIGPPSRTHYKTPQDMKEAIDLAVTAFEKSTLSSETAGGEDIPVYRSLDPERDYNVRRLASEPLNKEVYASDLIKMNSSTAEGSSSDSSVHTMSVYWKPYMDARHPNYDDAVDRASIGPKPFQMEGIIVRIQEEVDWSDDDPCPIHQEYGVKGMSFKDCCKTMHLKRVARAKRTSAFAFYFYNPFEKKEADLLHQALMDGAVEHIMRHVRLGPMDVQVGRIRIPTSTVVLVKESFDMFSPLHTLSEYKWAYKGQMVLQLAHGMMLFDEIDMEPTTGVIEFKAMTAERAAHLIWVLTYVCADLDILEASLEAQPANKMKPDMEMLEKNGALLKKGLNVEVDVSVDKKANEAIGRSCAYCEETTGKLYRCSRCESAYYCCNDHKVLHKADHREECMKIAAIREAQRK